MDLIEGSARGVVCARLDLSRVPAGIEILRTACIEAAWTPPRTVAAVLERLSHRVTNARTGIGATSLL